MKRNLIKYITVIAGITICCGNSVAQQANTVYFMQGVEKRNVYNPAFQSPYNFYFNLPLNFRVSAGNNSLVFNDIIFNQRIDGKDSTITFLHPLAPSDRNRNAFFNKLRSTTRVNLDATVDILGIGFRTGKNFLTFDVRVREEAGVYMPKDLFSLALYGMEKTEKFDFGKLGFNASLYTEVALGFSRQFDDKLTIGLKAKYLTGIFNASTDISKFGINAGPEKWMVEGSGGIRGSFPSFVDTRKFFKTDEEEQRVIDFDNLKDAVPDNIRFSDIKIADFLSNSGFGFDIGVTYNVTPELQLSAAATDLGFIKWKNNTAKASISKYYTFEGINYIAGEDENVIIDKLKDELDKLKGVLTEDNSEAYTTSLPARLNVGAEYGLLNNKIAIGLLSSTLYTNKSFYPELTASVNFRPCNWVHPSVSYSVLDGQFKTIGVGAQFKLGMVNIYAAADKIPVGKGLVKYDIPIPKYMTGTNIQFGIVFAFGDSRSWKNRDDDRDGVKNKKDRCPDTPFGWPVDKYGCHFDADGDGVPDHLDKCPNTPQGVQVDSKGCPIDSDGDGVPDYLDRCPGTPIGVEVDEYGCPIDSDGDGVPDYLDNCPNTPKGVQVNEFGCPDDSDGDGVPDHLDKCPNTPKGVKVDKDGCPIDSDGDGVPDYLDKCPDTPKGVKVDKDGCPIDSDGDGVPDYLDKCPNVPGPAWNDGCPELKEKEKAVFEKALHGIQFASGKADITKASYTILDAIVLIMKENTHYFLTINGHTDNVGTPESNQILSEKRAGAVRDYLIMQGIARDRVKSQGFGDTRPVVENTTAENKAQNRRVEFIVRYEKEI